jgi:hypothetical protein
MKNRKILSIIGLALAALCLDAFAILLLIWNSLEIALPVWGYVPLILFALCALAAYLLRSSRKNAGERGKIISRKALCGIILALGALFLIDEIILFLVGRTADAPLRSAIFAMQILVPLCVIVAAALNPSFKGRPDKKKERDN